MSAINGCNIPEELYYVVEKHVWARQEADSVVIGLTDVAQSLAHTIISVTSKGAGKPIKRGKSVATVESGKWVGPVPSPVEGQILAVNEALAANPSLLNRDPYGEGWIARLQPTDWSLDVAELVTGVEGVAAYQAFLDAQGISCGGE